MRVLFIHNQKITEELKKHYYIDEFIKLNYTFVYVSLYNCKIYQNREAEKGFINEDINISYPKNINEALQIIEDANSMICFQQIPFNINTFKIFKTLNSINCRVYNIDFYSSFKMFLFNLLEDEKQSRLKKIMNRDVFKFVKNYIQSKYIYYLESKYNKTIYFKTGRTNPPNISISSKDYEVWLNTEQIEKQTKGRYAVFLDSYLPSHPDKKRSGNISALNNYYFYMDKIFTHIENKFDVSIIIASHPKAKYSTEFGDRKVVSGKLPELMMNCEFSICHFSMSMSYSILNRKPIIFVYHNDFQNNEKKYIISLAKYFGMPCINEVYYDLDIQFTPKHDLVFNDYKFRVLEIMNENYETNFKTIKSIIERA